MPANEDAKTLCNDNLYILTAIEKSQKLRKKLNYLGSQNYHAIWFEKIAGYLLDASKIAEMPIRR